VRGEWYKRLTVNNSKVLLQSSSRVVVYETDGRFVRFFGEETLKKAIDITAVNDGRVMVVEVCASCVHIFSEDGDYLSSFELQGLYVYHPSIAFHQASEHVVIAGAEGSRTGDYLLRVEIFTKDGEFVRSLQIPEEGALYTNRMTVTKVGRIAVLLENKVYHREFDERIKTLFTVWKYLHYGSCGDICV